MDPFPFWLKIDADCGLPGLAFRSRDMLAQRRYLVARSPSLPISLRVAGLSLSWEVAQLSERYFVTEKKPPAPSPC